MKWKITNEAIFRRFSLIIFIIFFSLNPLPCHSDCFSCTDEKIKECWTCSEASSVISCAFTGHWESCLNEEKCSLIVLKNMTSDNTIYNMGCYNDSQANNGSVVVQSLDSSVLECSSYNIGALCTDPSNSTSWYQNLFRLLEKALIIRDAYKASVKCKQMFTDYEPSSYNKYIAEETLLEVVNKTREFLIDRHRRAIDYSDAARGNGVKVTGIQIHKPMDYNKQNQIDSNYNPGKSHKCSPIMCLMFCEYGFEKDKFGCDLCRCANSPCQLVLCQATEHCEVKKVEDSSTHVTTYQAVCSPNACLPVLCNFACQYGYMKDASGCEYCKCFEPCEGFRCGSGEHCEIQPYTPCESHPYTTRGVCIPDKKCSPITCRMFCENGFLRDEFGCEYCRCYEPCQNVTCNEREHCQIQLVDPSSLHPYNTLGVCTPNRPCLPVLCRMACRYGFEKDEYGCEYCSCYEPCQIVECRERFHCEVHPTNATVAHPYNYEPLCVPNKRCSPVRCLMFCEHGFLKDEFGCEFCRCFEPCLNVTCNENEHCEVQEVDPSPLYSYRTQGVCLPNNRCSPVLCKMLCPYGFAKDEFGCEICQCYEPCQVVRCRAGFHCSVLPENTTDSSYQYRAACVPDGECSPVLCRMFCEHGFMKDEFGCEYCRCFKPCENVACQEEEKCEIKPVVPTASHPYDTQGVCTPRRVCLPVLCRMFCRYGFQKDEFGCEICSCYEPCELIDCRDGLYCEVQPVIDTESHPYKYQPVCVPNKHCECSIHGDPILHSFSRTYNALLEPKQYTMTSYGDDLHGDGLLIYVIVEQTDGLHYPGNLDIDKLTINYGKDFIVMYRDKVTVNSRFATPLPYADPAGRFTISSQTENYFKEEDTAAYIMSPRKHVELTTTYYFHTISGISLEFSPQRHEKKVQLTVPHRILADGKSTGLCGVCN